MKRGFEAVRAEAAALAEKPLPDALKAIGTKLVMTVGGASGPLFGTLFMSARQGAAGSAGPRRPGRSVGEVRSMRSPRAASRRPARRPCSTCSIPVQAALAAGKTAREVADAADAAAEATKPIKAIRGRASFLGDRSIGHMDPGARSSALIVRAIAETLEPGA